MYKQGGKCPFRRSVSLSGIPFGDFGSIREFSEAIRHAVERA